MLGSDAVARAMERLRRPGGLWPAALAGLVGLALTTQATVYALRTVRVEEEARFQSELVAAQEAIDKRMQAYLALLLSGQSLFVASEDVERDEFRRWATALRLPELFPGIQGIGFAAVVPPGKVDEFVARARASGEPSFRVTPPGDRPLVSSILYLEPRDARNRAALGYDMFSEPVRREAMIRARDTGLPAASGAVVLRQEITPEKQAGFLIYVPVYDPRLPVHTVAERRAALRGWVYAPFRAQDLVEGIFDRRLPPVGVEAYDGTTPEAGALLFDTNQHREGLDPGVERIRVRTLDIAGRPWTLVFTPAEGLPGRTRMLPWLVGLVGLLGSILLFGITWVQAAGRRRERAARGQAERAEAEALFLSDVSKMLASSLDIGETIDRLALQMVSFLAETCVVDVLAENGELECLALAAREGNPRLAATVARIRAHYPRGSPLVQRVVATGRPEIVPEVTEEWLARAYPDREGRELIASLHHGSIAILPLATRDRVHGAILLAAAEPHYFRRSRAALAEEVARRAAQVIESAALYRQTREAVRIRDDFLSIASHELRTPLTSLQAQVQVLRRNVGRRGPALDRARLEERLEVIERQVLRLGKLVTTLLDVARIRSGRFEIQRERFELAELVREAVERFSDDHGAPTMAVTATGPAVGNWDRFRLEQVVVNLLGNAVKYGEGRPIDVRIEPGPRGVRLAVQDRGIGIPPEKQELVFERFGRAVSDRHYGGLGLGLFIVREIVHAHGGTVGVESRPGEGATFLVDLPWGEESAAQTA
jgi:signal transduction histidine kinase